jgi:two-component system chemotaxis response regulator CheY
LKSKDDLVANINKKPPRGLKVSGESFKVLIVDDSATMRKIIEQILKSEMYDICGEASDGDEALELYKELNPDIITLDIHMPKVSGLDTLASILKFDPKAKVIMLTSEGQKETVMEAVKMGAKNYIIKPPDRKNVLEKIETVING